jgi:hypothetical protein
LKVHQEIGLALNANLHPGKVALLMGDVAEEIGNSGHLRFSVSDASTSGALIHGTQAAIRKR